jgi:hypothetical protein
MSPFVDECQREWRRLGVPDSIADEMAAEIDADLLEAQADGISAAELLGEEDPRVFAATWASARGLLPEPKTRGRSRTTVVVGIAALIVGAALTAALTTGRTSSSNHPPRRRVAAQQISLPNFYGMKEHAALRLVARLGLTARVTHVPHGLAGMVFEQSAFPGTPLTPAGESPTERIPFSIPRGARIILRVGRG